MARYNLTAEEAERAAAREQEWKATQDARNRQFEADPDYGGYIGSDKQFLSEELQVNYAPRVPWIARVLGRKLT